MPEREGNTPEDGEVCTIHHQYLEYFQMSSPFLNVPPPYLTGALQRLHINKQTNKKNKQVGIKFSKLL